MYLFLVVSDLEYEIRRIFIVSISIALYSVFFKHNGQYAVRNIINNKYKKLEINLIDFWWISVVMRT